jgi:hypothetical protein
VNEAHVSPGDRLTIGRTEITVYYRCEKTEASGDEAAVEAVVQPSPQTPETLDLLYGNVTDEPQPGAEDEQDVPERPGDDGG